MESTITLTIKADNALELKEKQQALKAFEQLDNDTALKVSKIINSPKAKSLLASYWSLLKFKL
jgi:hypothetical protein